MKKVFVGAAVLATLATGCQNEEIISQPSGEGQLFTLEIGKDVDSRTTIGENKATLWSKGDKIYVSGNNGTINGYMTLIKGDGSSTATFSGLIFGGSPADLDYVVFPAPDKDNKIDMSLREAGKLDAPMIGTINNGATATLKNVGGLLAVKVDGGDGNVYDVKASEASNGNMTGGYYEFNPATGTLTYIPVDNPVSTEVIDGLAYVPVATTLAATNGSNTSSTSVTVNVVVTEENDDTPIVQETVTVTGGQIMGDEADESVPSFSVDENGDATEYISVSDSTHFLTLVNKENKSQVAVKLTQDLKTTVTAWQDLAFGTENTKTIIIDGAGKTITFNQINSDWNNITTNGAKLIIKNAHITNCGHNDGPWNRHDLNFGCEVELINVTTDKAIALKAGGNLNNVTINDANTSDTYAIWIQPNGQTVSLEGCTIDMIACSDGRGIKIDEQYVTAQKVTLNVSNTVFKTEEKAAILVKSKAGADINLTNVINISEVAADNKNAVWVDAASADYYNLVTVTGGTKAQEQE
ncbi:MAG: hypothetical protein IJB96_04585 [Lachnospira sp.]|nr:hypothetical protein [Lachnospira sp.]